MQSINIISDISLFKFANRKLVIFLQAMLNNLSEKSLENSKLLKNSSIKSIEIYQKNWQFIEIYEDV